MLKQDKLQIEATLLPDYGRKKLLGYAETFRDLAKTYANDAEGKADTKKGAETMEDRQDMLCQRRLIENREILADHLSEVAQIMTHVAEESYQMIRLSHKKQKQIIQMLKSNGIAVQTICLIEHANHQMEVSMQMRACKNRHFETEEVAGILSVLLNRRLVPGKNSLLYLSSESDLYVFEEETEYNVFAGMAKAVKEKETMSGDNYTLMNMGNGKYICAISDGMGSGEKACEDSALVIDLLEKLLEAGFEEGMAIQMINGTLIAYDEKQNMSTLDLCEIDLRTGLSMIWKAGASHSFIKRENSVEILEGNSLPLGVFHQMDLTAKYIQLKEGDYVIMVSDGIVDAFKSDDASYILQEFMERIEMKNPREIANHILQFVIHASGGEIKDDMTVCVAGLFVTEGADML